MGKRGPVPKPSAVKKKHGTYRPSRAAKDEMTNEVPLGRPVAPSWLDDEARKEWDRVVPILEKARVLTEADQAILASYCSAHSLSVKATRAYQKEGLMQRPLKGSKMVRKHPMIKVAQEARAQALRLGAEFGLSPASRTRVSSMPEDPNKEKGDKAEEFLFGPPQLTVVE